jgi:hypothetical protein
MVKNGVFKNTNATPYSDYIRNNIFHYALFGHSLGGPYDSNGQAISNVPWSVSGVAEKPGGDLMITLGKWTFTDSSADHVGTATVQAGTLMHELGHNFGLSHAGLQRNPQCMPNYHSVMNYLYQVRGLTLNSDNQQYVDYSFASATNALTETSLNENVSLGQNVKYRTRYYGPVSDGAATKHCDGSDIGAGETAVARLEGSGVNTPDWNNDGDLLDSGLNNLDVNFNGTIGDGLPVLNVNYFIDSNDWAYLNLRQVGAKRSFGGLSLFGDTYIDGGDTYIDGGDTYIDGGDTYIDGGDTYIDGGAPALAEDVTHEAAVSSIDAPSFTASALVNAIHTAWKNRDEIAQISSYDIYRSDPFHPTPARVQTINFPGTSWDDIITDTSHTGKNCPATKTCYDTTYMYYVKAKDINGNFSPKSNTATALVPNPKR